jgi:hypothetical protein
MIGGIMQLTDIDLKGLGRFSPDPAAFTCTRYNLPEPWDYVYTNSHVLLRINHDGTGYLQLDPPGGAALLRLERGHAEPNLFAWIIPEERGQAFANFWRPNVATLEPKIEPDEYACEFSPDAARYRLRNRDWLVETELWVPPDQAAVVMTVTVTNKGGQRRVCTVVPVVKPHMATLSLAPWDVPAMYQTCAFCGIGGHAGFWLETRNPGGDPSKRLRATVVSDLVPDSFEVALHDFIGHGTWRNPQAIWNGGLARKVNDLPKYGVAERENAVIGGQPPLAALAKKIELDAGKSFQFTVVFGKLPTVKDGKLPPISEAQKLAAFLKPDVRAKALEQLREQHCQLFAIRKVETPDACFNRYVNEFLPLQLKWVSQLDRGWPTGMRGTRDASQDATGMIPLDPALARKRLAEIFAVQRADGWFLRQFSTAGRYGNHDTRSYVDSGIWVWEFLLDYICYTRDFAFLKVKLGWLDSDKQSTVLDHAIQLLDYYLKPENLGKHGLCKIRAGDWNDSVNLAGLDGRGESVMVSCQVVLGLEQASELFTYLGDGKLKSKAKAFAAAAEKLRKNILKHALNNKGYLNAVFNDAGKWIFSPKDPDGNARINGPANSFGVIAGVIQGNVKKTIFNALDSLKGPYGWRLFHPPIGNPPIEKLGRIGAGDLAPGLSENGTPYNHGSQGFLGRAAWSGGRGRMLYHTLRYMFPYDQSAHPVLSARTAPYGVVNHWREAVGMEGTGGDTFLSGSISTAIRNCYQGMIGFRPDLEFLFIDPCVPAEWKKLSASVRFLDAEYTIAIKNPKGVECGVAALKLDGKSIDTRVESRRLERKLAVIPMSLLKKGANHAIEVTMG